jgi:hypothetical protein
VFELVGVIGVLHRIGALTWLGPEVISPELAALPPGTAAQLADSRTRTVVAAATSPGVPPRRPRRAIGRPSQQ